jgi:hypothetical protein
MEKKFHTMKWEGDQKRKLHLISVGINFLITLSKKCEGTNAGSKEDP